MLNPRTLRIYDAIPQPKDGPIIIPFPKPHNVWAIYQATIDPHARVGSDAPQHYLTRKSAITAAQNAALETGQPWIVAHFANTGKMVEKAKIVFTKTSFFGLVEVFRMETLQI